MVNVTVTIDDAKVKALLKKIGDGVVDLKKPLDDAGDELIKFYGDENFDKQGSALGTSWKPLAVSTLQARARRYGHYGKAAIETQKALIWTGKLKKGFTKVTTKTLLTIENNVQYFKFNAKTRPMLGLGTPVTDIVLDSFNSYLKTLVK
ncbi:MAG: hypothetical protein V3T43_06145 [Nitrosomonadaceae bacterium]